MNILRRNQINAINKFKEYFFEKENNRGILSKCCGSGKTRTFYEIIKLCINEKKENFFIYSTSRILLVKSVVLDLIEWLYLEKKINIHLLIKVSDLTLQDLKKELLKKNKDLLNYFSSGNYIKILENNDLIDVIQSKYLYEQKIIILITTYDSISKIIDTISDYNKINDNKQINPNLLICDEAHNLVSSENELKITKKILESNEDKIFYPDKYLFMTATPLKIIKRNNNDSFIDNNIVFSMNNIDLYGDIFYEYTFYEGIQDNYILDFDIIYLTDFDKENNDELKIIIDSLDYDNKDEQQKIYFNVISLYLLKTIEQYNLHHTLVFISNQNKAELLNNLINEHINEQNLNDKIESYCLYSKSTLRINKNKFETYEKNKSKILVTVNMFNEGIDIPICDSILFAEERNSETVIVQNIGRALRKYNNSLLSKNKAYVIIPTKIYKLDDEICAFSSKFKKIREICDILKEKPDKNNPIYYNRKTKGNTKNFKNSNDDEDINENSGLVDNIINENNKIKNDNENEIENKIDNEKIKNKSKLIFSSFDIISCNNNISNMKLEKFKKLVQEAKISSLLKLSEFIINNSISIDRPHIYYKNDWICYGDFLFNKVYSFKESNDIIRSLNLINVTSSKEWLDYYNNIISNGFESDENNDILNKIIYIPYNPKTYYLQEWTELSNGWEDFLGKSLTPIIGVEKKTNNGENINADKNLTNIINQDKEKIIKLLKGSWQTYCYLQLDVSDLKNYINNEFNIKCDIEIRYRLHNNFKLDTQIINILIEKFNYNKYLVPITIDFNYKIKFDRNIYNLTNLKNNNINRTEEKFIQRVDLRNIINNIKYELKYFINSNLIT